MKIYSKFFLFIVLIMGLAIPAMADDSKCQKSPLVKGACFKVVGTLNTYNGWPPSLRIEPKSDGKLYGVGPEENEIIPSKIRKVLPTEIEGEFILCPFNETISVPYDERRIEMVCIQDVNNATYWDRKTDTQKKLK